MTEQEEHYRMLDNILINLPAYIFWKDANLVYQGCSKKIAEAVAEDSVQAIIGRTDYDFGWNEERIDQLHTIDRQVLQGKEIENEDIIPVEDKCYTMLTSKTPLRNRQGEIIGILGVSTDIIERKALEESLKQMTERYKVASETKSEFIQNMSHDLRTALTGLLSIAEAQADSLPDNHEYKMLFLIMRDSARDLHQFCEAVLEIASLDYRDSIDKHKTFSIDDLINKKVALFKPTLMDRSLTCFIKSLHCGSIPKLFGHPLMIERILINLIGNAIKFTDTGSITIRYDLIDVPSENGMTHQLELVISDTGKGIPQDKQDIIFECFSRLSPSYQGLYKGLGL